MRKQWRRNAWVLWVAVTLHGMAWTAVIPYMPVYLENDLGVQNAKAWAGVLTSVFAFCGAIVGPIWGAMGDRYGRIRFITQAGLVMGLTYVLMIFATGPWELLGIRVLTGMFSGFGALAMSIVAVNTPPEGLGWAMGLQQTAFPSGALVGPAIGGVIYDLYGIRWAMAMSAVLILTATFLSVLLVREGPGNAVKATAGPRPSIASALKAAAAYPGLLGVLVITIIAKGSMASLEPVFVPFVKELAVPGTPNWLVGSIYALSGVAFVVGVGWWTRVSKRIGYERTLSWGLACGTVLLILQGVSRTPYELAVFRVGGGIMEAAIIPGVVSLLAISVPLSMRGTAFGLNQSANLIGLVIGPLIGGFVGTYLGSRFVFLVAAVGMAVGLIWAKRTFGRGQGDGEMI